MEGLAENFQMLLSDSGLTAPKAISKFQKFHQADFLRIL